MKLRSYTTKGRLHRKQDWLGRFCMVLILLLTAMWALGPTTTPPALAGPALAQPVVPDVVGLPQSEAEATITDAGLTVGTVTSENSDTVPSGDVISQNPVAGSPAKKNLAVDLVVSAGPAAPTPITVPDVGGLTQADAEAAVNAAGFVLGTVTPQDSDTIPAGVVISQNPVAGDSAAPGSAVDLVVSSGPAVQIAVTVPDVVGLPQADAEADLVAANLVTGTIALTNSDVITAGVVISQNPVAGDSAALGSAVDLVVSSGPAAPTTVTVPDVVNKPQADAEADLVAANLVTGTIALTNSDVITAGLVISQNPVAGDSAALGSAVDLVVSSGPAAPTTVTVPDVINKPQADAEADLVAANLVTGTIALTNSDTITAGLVISQNPVAGDSVAPGSAVDLVVSAGPSAPTTVTVPDVVNKPQADAEADLVAANLITGTIALTNSDVITAGLVMEQNPAAGSTIAPGSAVDLVISSGPAVANVVVTAAPLVVQASIDAVPCGPSDVLCLNVVSTTGGDISNYKYIINIDNTGTTAQRSPDSGTGCNPNDGGYPGSCAWVSIAGAASNSPIYTQGNQDDFTLADSSPGGIANLPDGRYLISVIADGFKLDGEHFSVPLDGPVTVKLQPFPLPDATIQAAVFEDISPVNGAPDLPAEHGLAGFVGHIADYIGEVTTDVYGDPLCGGPGQCVSKCYVVDAGVDIGTVAPIDSAGRCPIDPTGLTMIEGGAVPTTAAIEGKLKIPNLGPNRYALSIIPPDGSNWIQTTTLEGNHDWDAWVMEGATGLDTEFVIAGEPFPAIIFGYVQETNNLVGGTGEIKGVVDAFKAYVPAKGGVTSYEPYIGSRIDKPIDSPWLALSDLGNGDTAVWVGQGDANGAFSIPNVPDGTYTLSWWDEPQDYILNLQNVTVVNGEVVDLGVLPLNGWWTQLDGYVFSDENRNGVFDWNDLNGNGCPDGGAEGEKALSNFTLTLRKRENSLMDRGATLVTTDGCGYYYMENAYPMTQWLVMEAYSDLYYTTGVTYQADNQPAPTTILGAGVDISVLPIIGLSGRLDWGVHNYAPTGGTPGVDPDNGGIVGTVSYDTTRNEIDPRYAAVEDWQPGISDLTVNLYASVDCPVDGSAPCDPTERFELDTDGSFLKGQLLNTYVTETWQRPDSDCVPRDVNGDPLAYPADQQVTNAYTDCLEGPLMGVQFNTYATDQGTPDANFGAAVDGNYGFGDGCFNGALDASDPANPVCLDTAGNDIGFTPLTVGDYLVEVEIPNDATGRPMYQVTKEEDINIANGDQFIPQVPPPECAGPLHTVDVATIGTDGWPEVIGDGGVTNNLPVGVAVPASTPVVNTTFANELNGSYYEGQQKPLCSTKLVHLSNGKSVAPTFNLFTDVPLPGRFWGLIVDDLNFSSNPKSLLYGEKAGVPFAPVGIYDYTNRLITTVESDYNGLFDVLLPSTNRISCPTPSGVCANLYRFVGNDPGIPGHLNLNFNPQFRTIAAEFEAFPGLIVPADLAPTQMGVSVQLPGSQFNQPVTCTLDPAIPQLFAVSQPYADLLHNASGSFTITGQGFGASAGQVKLDGTIMPITAWSDTSISVSVPATTPGGPYQLKITAANGQTTVNSLTFHVLGFGPFPSTPVLDNFNRTGFGQDWNVPGGNTFSLSNNNVRVTGTGTMRWSGSVGGGPVYGSNQEAYFTFVKVSPTATEQGLFLKVTGNGNNPDPTASQSANIEVSYDAVAQAVQVRTKASGTSTVVLQDTFPATFAAGDTLGARALADGTVIAYQNGNEIGRVNVTTTANPWPNAAGGGRLGIRFVGVDCNNANCTNGNDARIDNFGGGTAVGYTPNVYEVGPGKTYDPGIFDPNNPSHAIQDALDAAAASTGDDLVVVYPGTPQGDRINPRGAYYENLIIPSPVKLQGVGPGSPDGSVLGSIIDGSAFGGDTALAEAWRDKVAGLIRVGNQTVSEGEVIYLLAQSETQYGSGFKAAIDGFDIRGGDQQGQANILTQGGAIFANAYIRYLQITNNIIEANSSSYGTIRIGTPDLPAPNTSQHNENLRIAYNRIIANGGTNLAGGIALFAGADMYSVDHNDLCGNFSAEYGGGLSAYGYSPGGTIHHNRVYFNSSYDEGGGLIVAGQLPADPTTLSPGSGPVNVYNNLIQGNLANDDGGGLRFLMAGNYPINVFNNMIVNNISTHEGGGIGLDDTPNVRAYNNTIMKNLTTATAVTSNGSPAPAGLSTSANSAVLQATLPGGSPIFSNPLLFDNIFWDNRAGTRGVGTVTGLGAPGDATPINYWDLGVADGTGTLLPTSSIIQAGDGAGGSDPQVINSYDTGVTFDAWRNNPAFVGAIMVTVDNPPNLLGNYHLNAGSPAIDMGASAKDVPAYQQQPDEVQSAPTFDFDDQMRPICSPPALCIDIGADEVQ